MWLWALKEAPRVFTRLTKCLGFFASRPETRKLGHAQASVTKGLGGGKPNNHQSNNPSGQSRAAAVHRKSLQTMSFNVCSHPSLPVATGSNPYSVLRSVHYRLRVLRKVFYIINTSAIQIGPRWRQQQADLPENDWLGQSVWLKFVGTLNGATQMGPFCLRQGCGDCIAPRENREWPICES